MISNVSKFRDNFGDDEIGGWKKAKKKIVEINRLEIIKFGFNKYEILFLVLNLWLGVLVIVVVIVVVVFVVRKVR